MKVVDYIANSPKNTHTNGSRKSIWYSKQTLKWTALYRKRPAAKNGQTNMGRTSKHATHGKTKGRYGSKYKIT